MKPIFAMLVILSNLGATRAQDRVPDEEARQIAQLLIEAEKTQAKAPIAMDVDPTKPFAMHKDKHGAMFLPDKKLTAELIDKAGKDLTPVGQLWVKQVSPISAGDKPISDRFQSITVKKDDQEVQVKVCYLAVQRGEKDGVQLVLLGKDKTPILTTPIEKVEQKQELPIEFSAKGEGDDKAMVTVQLLGKFQCKLLFVATE